MDCLYGEAQARGPYLRMVDTVLVAISYDRAGIDARTLSAFHDVVSTGLAFDGWL